MLDLDSFFLLSSKLGWLIVYYAKDESNTGTHTDNIRCSNKIIVYSFQIFFSFVTYSLDVCCVMYLVPALPNASVFPFRPILCVLYFAHFAISCCVCFRLKRKATTKVVTKVVKHTQTHASHNIK